ncbi:MAG: Uroporphyrinogen deCOase protein [Candidatus Hydrogenedentes bacterium]|nr:Uroporphyrinogen deCOase protein [Candidatus Hydrogenedentota bacterium]
MAYSGVMDDIRRAVAMERPARLPVFCCSEEMDVRVCGSRYDRYNSDTREMARVQIEAIERFGYDWAWLQVDDCLEFEPLGVGVKGGGDILPATCAYLPATDASLDALRQHGYRAEDRMRVLLDAIASVKARFGDTVCVTGRTAAPFSSVTLTFGITETMVMLFENPAFVHEACKVFEEYQTRFGLDQLEAGADAIWFGDCNASGHLISPANYREFAMEPARHVSEAYRAAGGVVFYHASEELPAMIDLQADCGFSILSVGPGIAIEQARDVVHGRVCLSGNVDPIAVLANGTPDDVRREVTHVVEHVSRHGGHVMNSGEMVPRDTPEENIHAFVAAARDAWNATIQ